jgi:hypothetical protein
MAKGGGASPSLRDRLMRRGSKEEDSSDDGADNTIVAAANAPDDGLDALGHALSDIGIDPVGGAVLGEVPID